MFRDSISTCTRMDLFSYAQYTYLILYIKKYRGNRSRSLDNRKSVNLRAALYSPYILLGKGDKISNKKEYRTIYKSRATKY